MKNILFTISAISAIILIILPALPSSSAGNFIYLSLCSDIILFLQIILLIYTVKKRGLWKYTFGILFVASWLAYGKNNIPIGMQTDNKHDLSIISWNVENFHINKETLKKAAQYINKFNPDIICLQERPHNNLLHQDSIRAEFPEHPYFCTNKREDEVLNIAILSKYPLNNVQTYYFEPGYNKMIKAEVATPNDTITLFNIHLQTTGKITQFIENAQRRNRQADTLRKLLTNSKHPAIICGDFNDTPASYAYRTISHGVNDCYSIASKKVTGSYQPLGNIFRIDYTLCSKEMQPVDYQLLRNQWSDHKIQYATIAIGKSN